MEFDNYPINTIYETGEEQLNRLIKEAGEEARSRKKNALALHYKKIKAVIAEGVIRRHQNNNELSEAVK
jgi:hypothetical protein